MKPIHLSNVLARPPRPKRTKRFIAWRVDKAPDLSEPITEQYERQYDSFEEALAWVAKHPTEDFEIEDRIGSQLRRQGKYDDKPIIWYGRHGKMEPLA